ncbi:carbohydrate esterase family 3 protein [Bimuria novae-zelandiae CBS 107.79]|uniref:Carbohydrate esterase family 3 protein n=1 Tax=Bimuria novae-zelandiae CBS 107.79 TaxID=1447943 RepID=A0A6A5V2N9_9PLEO|nr:carbohydrate esterase family 3 protein [Bimuria novae-zelandiae CBS 107.79]
MVPFSRPIYGHGLLVLITSAISLLADAAPTRSSTHSTSFTVVPTPSGNGSIDFTSAVQHEVSVLLEQERLSTVPAIPVPTNSTRYPEYKAIGQIAPVLPPKQQGIRYLEPSAIVANLVSSTNSTSGTSLHQRQSSTRILIVGDSITQGAEGDCTWRYRIWQWLRSTGINFRIVGPYVGTKAPPPPAAPQPPGLYGSPADTSFSTDGGYCEEADSAFLAESNHFAVWGRAAAVDKGLIAGVLQSTPADMMFLFLGFNDIGWFYSDVSGTLASIQSLITNARSVNPNMKFAVANIPHRTHINGRDDLATGTDEYNRRLPDLLTSMSTSQSPVHLVDIADNYACSDSECPSGYDGLHPNGCGEFQLARAFSKTLIDDFGIGSSPLKNPCQSGGSVDRRLELPSNIRAFSSPQGVTVTWDKVYGAYSYDVEASANGVPASFSTGSVLSNRWDSQWPLEGWVYKIRVRAVCGDKSSDWTSYVTATATPKLPSPPRNIRIQPSSSGMTVTWDPPTGDTGSIVLYNVLYWDWQWDHCQFISAAAFKSSPAVIDGLVPGRNYAIWLVTWNENGQGIPSNGSAVLPGKGTPSVPSALEVISYDPTTVGLSWSGADSAAGYRVWYRNINTAGSEMQLIGDVTMNSDHCNDQYFLFPGVWNYAFAVSSFNGHLDSGRSPEVVAPSAAKGDNIEPTCGPEPAWCPGGGSVSVPPVGGGTPTGGNPTTTSIGVTLTTTGSQPSVTGYPIVTNGHCAGRDCVGGKCVGR